MIFTLKTKISWIKKFLFPKKRVSEFREMANSSRYKTPLFQTFDELERKYWKSISYIPPIYGADVNGSLFGEEIENWNVSKLDTCLDIIGVDSGKPLFKFRSIIRYCTINSGCTATRVDVMRGSDWLSYRHDWKI